MKKIFLSILLSSFIGYHAPMEAKKDHILPIPQKVETLAEGTYSVPEKSSVIVAGIKENPTLKRFFNEFGITDITFNAGATSGNVVVEMVSNIPGAHNHDLAGYDNEAYTLEVSSAGIKITAVTEIGVTRAAQTLTQLAEGYDAAGIHLEFVKITDWPAFKLRGFMHDIGRSYIDVATIKKHIDLLSRFKVNTFHWHFTENQAWRFQVKAYPELTLSKNMTRHEGKFYTQDECKEVQEYAYERGIYIIPEIDMPGHSEAFVRAMGVDMQSTQGKVILKKILDEVGQVFDRAPYIHIGADEKATTAAYVNEMVDYVKNNVGKRCMVWNPISGVSGSSTNADMCQLWSTNGTSISGKYNIDCRYNYTNHFDVFADLVGIYKSTIYYKDKGDGTISGTISGMWNDRKLESQEDIIAQNNFFANVIASTSRAWQGGGKRYIDNGTRGGTNFGGGVMLPSNGEEYDDFLNWETRFLFHKAHSLKDQPIPYVKQTNVRWRISDAFPNNGNVAAVFPPEEQMDSKNVLPDSYTYNGTTYNTGMVTGAGIYLRHTWGESIINAYYSAPAYNQTAYAWTYVYSPKTQTVGAQIEFQNYSRSEQDPAPSVGNWDLMGSKIWINNKEIAAPSYKNSGVSISNKEVTLKNENFPAREPIQVELKEGWNLVFLKLPYINAATRLDKWMFTCVFTDTKGIAAVDGLIYSPNQCMDEAAENVAAKISEAKNLRNGKVRNQPGYYSEDVATELDATIAKIETTLSQEMSAAERNQQLADLDKAIEDFNASLATAELVQPTISYGTQEYFYTLSTPLRGNRYATSHGANADMVGETSASKAAHWKFVTRADGTLDIVNSADGTFVSPNSSNDTALKTQATSPSKGWTLSPANEVGYFIITSGTVQFNQTNNSTLGWKVYNWGNGTNTDDTGCKYSIQAVEGDNIPDEVVDPALPEVGKTYYLCNKHQKGDVFFYDNGGSVGFGTSAAKNNVYGWRCVANTNNTYDFVNLSTGKYFVWKALGTSAYGWTLDTTVGSQKVVNEGCFTMKAPISGSNYLVVKNASAFDQSTIAGYYNETFSSDYYVLPFEEKEEVSVNIYSKSYGENWVRMLWKNDNNDAAGLAASPETDYTKRTTHSMDIDMTDEEQLWCLVGSESEGVKIYNRAAGEQYALHVANTSEATPAKMVATSSACSWKIVAKNGFYAITPASNTNMSINSYGGPNCPLKLYSASDNGSLWNFEVVTEGMKMTTVIDGENPYAENNIWAGDLGFSIDGVKTTSRIPAKTEAVEATYYLRKGAEVVLTQENSYRGFRLGGFVVDGTPAESVTISVGNESKTISTIFNVAPETGQYLYHTPDIYGKPYRIPAIAQAFNGDIIAISDNRPCGSDIGYGEVDIKCRISTDQGKTWGKEFMLADGLGIGNKEGVWKTGFGDAAVVADAEKNEVLVMMVCGYTVCWNGNYIPNSSESNPNRVARIYGTLDETTGQWKWTEPEEVTETIYPLFVKNGTPTVQSLFIGSGRICQSRIVKVKDYYRLYCSVWTKNEGNRVIYSDDFGRSWNILGTVDDRPATGGDEPKCEEMPDGSVILSSRTSGRVFNIYKYSDVKSGTGKWLGAVTSNSSNSGIAVGNSTNGEIMLVKAIRKSDNQPVTLALQSVPFANSRANVGIFYKEIPASAYNNVTALASNWTKGLQVSKLGSAYSTMTLQHDYRIGFLFEEEPGGYSIVYLPLTIEDITFGNYALNKDEYITGITTNEVYSSATTGVYYDLQGRRVEQPRQGLYIVDGKKVLIK